MRKTWQGMPTESDIGGDKWNQIADHCNSNYYHIDMERYTLDAVLKKSAELVKRKGIKCLVIDPYNKVRDVGGLMMLTDTLWSICRRLKSLLKSMMY